MIKAQPPSGKRCFEPFGSSGILEARFRLPSQAGLAHHKHYSRTPGIRKI